MVTTHWYGQYAFWDGSKIRLTGEIDLHFRLAATPLVLCYEDPIRPPPPLEELERILDLLGEFVPAVEQFTFRIHVATLRAAAAEYFAGW